MKTTLTINKLNAAFTESELQALEAALYKLGSVYSGWISEELSLDPPCEDAAAYFETKLAAVQSLLWDVRNIRGGR